MKEGSLLQDLSTGVVGITGKVSEDYFNFSYLQYFSLPDIGGRLAGTICEYVLLGVINKEISSIDGQLDTISSKISVDNQSR